MKRHRLTGSINPPREFIPSGAAILDCVLGGGWAVGRIGNIVGDKSSGKTLCLIEACANFAEKYPDAPIWYNEAEAAFDEEYAKTLGIPINKVDFIGKNNEKEKCFTGEDFFNDLNKRLDSLQKGEKGLYCLDSLDALSDEAELERAIDKGSYGGAKAKKLSELFRRLNKRVSEAGITVLIVSQIRDKIGITFGETKGRSGGHALDFYASQIVWLSQVKTMVKISGGVKRAIGIRVKAKCKKNKVGPPLRECEFPILFGYGVDDYSANLEWLKEVGMLDRAGFKSEPEMTKAISSFHRGSREDRIAPRLTLGFLVRNVWKEIEHRFDPPQGGKY